MRNIAPDPFSGLDKLLGHYKGANKTIVSNRLKLNSARWTPKHAEAVAALRCLDYSGLWAEFWAEQAA